MSPKLMLKSANREVLPKSGDVSWQRLDRRLEHGIPFNWHHHPEMELTLTLNCIGQRFVGDSVSSFGDGDLAMVGANLPHTWTSQGTHRQVETLLSKGHLVRQRLAESYRTLCAGAYVTGTILQPGATGAAIHIIIPNRCSPADRPVVRHAANRRDHNSSETSSGIVPRRGRGRIVVNRGIAKDRCLFRADEPRSEPRPPEL